MSHLALNPFGSAKTVTYAASVTINCAEASVFIITLTGAITINLTGAPVTGKIALILKQDVTGVRVTTWGTGPIAWAAAVAPVLTTTGLAVNVITFYYDGATYYGAGAVINAI